MNTTKLPIFISYVSAANNTMTGEEWDVDTFIIFDPELDELSTMNGLEGGPDITHYLKEGRAILPLFPK